MEFGIVTNSQDGFETACKEHELNPDDTYVINSYQDLVNMDKEVTEDSITVFMAYDARETRLHEHEVFDVCYAHNRVFS